MWKSLLVSLAKELVFEGLIAVLEQEAKKSDNPLDDTAVQYIRSQKAELLAQLNKLF